MSKQMPKKVRVIDAFQLEWLVTATHWVIDDYGHAVTLYVNSDMVVTFISPAMAGWEDGRVDGPMVFLEMELDGESEDE